MSPTAGGGGGGGGGWDYVQDSEPAGAEAGESWYDTGSGVVKVYTGSGWSEMTVTDYSELNGAPSQTGTTSQNAGWYYTSQNKFNSIDSGQIKSYSGGETGVSDGVKATINGTLTDPLFIDRIVANRPDNSTTEVYSGGSSNSVNISHNEMLVTGYTVDFGTNQDNGLDAHVIEQHLVGLPSHNHTI